MDVATTAGAVVKFGLRRVAFTPRATFGSGGAPPPPVPTITPAQTSLPATIGDPTTVKTGSVLHGSLTVSANEQPVTDQPNTVTVRSKVQ